MSIKYMWIANICYKLYMIPITDQDQLPLSSVTIEHLPVCDNFEFVRLLLLKNLRQFGSKKGLCNKERLKIIGRLCVEVWVRKSERCLRLDWNVPCLMSVQPLIRTQCESNNWVFQQLKSETAWTNRHQLDNPWKGIGNQPLLPKDPCIPRDDQRRGIQDEQRPLLRPYSRKVSIFYPHIILWLFCTRDLLRFCCKPFLV